MVYHMRGTPETGHQLANIHFQNLHVDREILPKTCRWEELYLKQHHKIHQCWSDDQDQHEKLRQYKLPSLDVNLAVWQVLNALMFVVVASLEIWSYCLK